MYCCSCSGCQKLTVYDGNVREVARNQAAAVGALAEARLWCGARRQGQDPFNLVFSQMFFTVVLIIATLPA